MTFQEKPSYLPSDVRAYRAPRPRVDLALAVLAACLAVLLYVERVPEQINAGPMVATTGEGRKALIDNVAKRAAPLHGPSATAPSLDCLRLRDRLWLRGAIMHRGDRQQWAECWYGGIDRRDVL